MLDSPEEHVLQSACEALHKFAEKCKCSLFAIYFPPTEHCDRKVLNFRVISFNLQV